MEVLADAQVLVTGSCGDPSEMVFECCGGPCLKILKMLCFRGAYMKALLQCFDEHLVSRYQISDIG